MTPSWVVNDFVYDAVSTKIRRSMPKFAPFFYPSYFFTNSQSKKPKIFLLNCETSHLSPVDSPNSSFPLGSKILVKNFGNSVSVSYMRRLFSDFGDIAEVKLVRRNEESREIGNTLAFIQFTCVEDAILAMNEMNMKVVCGSVLRVEIAKPRNQLTGTYPIACGPSTAHSYFQIEYDEDDCWY